jgi:hypothetical protein
LLHSVNIDFEKALSLSGTQIIQVNFLMRSLDLHDVDDFFNFFVQIMKIQIWLPNLVFEQTSIQQVFNLEFKDVCPMSDHFSKLLFVLVILQFLNQQVRKANNAVNRGVHFMTDVRGQQVQ